MEMIMNIVNVLISIGNFLWGMPMLIVLLLLSVCLTIGCKGIQFRYFGHILKITLGSMTNQKESSKSISSFKAACMALCSTLGIGNITGVALAIAMGGPGAMLWIWVAAFLGMIIKYSEISLGVHYREIDPQTGVYRGGVMWYIKKGVDKRWHWLAAVFAGVYLIVVINAPAVQINTMVSSITAYFSIQPMLIGFIMVVLMALVGYSGIRRVSSITEKIIPVMAVAYFVIVFAILFMNVRKLPGTVGLIFKSAVADVEAVAGGFGGATVAMAARHGLCRGFYTNGAGSGDSTFSHSSAEVDHPVQQGVWAITDILVDVLGCTATGLVILITGVWTTGESGAPLAADAISAGCHSEVFGNLFIMISIILFAFASAFMCLYCSELCLRYFTQNRIIVIIYRCVICLWAFFATNETFVSQVSILWSLGDLGSACLMLINLFAVFLLRKRVFALTTDYKKIYLKQ